LKSELILFGRSPFIDKVDVPRLIEKYTTIGLNRFAQHYPVDHVFMFDRYFPHPLTGSAFFPHWFDYPMQDGQKFHSKASASPILTGEKKNDIPVLGYKYFTCSLALNWALLQGFTEIYLVGIDHVESDVKFVHHDGDVADSKLSIKAHQALKEYFYSATKHANIYQTNPDVRNDWKLPFVDINQLYS
jgi:hypothetical protein